MLRLRRLMSGGRGTLENRERGGSRPGLSAVGSVTTVTEETWQWPNGEPIEWPDGTEVTYSLSESNITAPDGTTIINPASLIEVSATEGTAPEDYTLSCIYRDRVIVVKDNLWYASRMGDYTDWDFGADMNDVGRAVAGAVGLAGVEGNAITAIIPHRDSALFIATANALYVLIGDPGDGRIETLDEDIGIIAPYGWSFHGGTLVFLSNDGVYVGTAGGAPKRFSEERIPEELKNIDADSNTVTMAYDPGERGFHLFITPEEGSGQHYWLDLPNKAIWPVAFADAGHQPVLTCRLKSDSLEEVVFQGRDGTWRQFDNDAFTDDGTAIGSLVLIGPVRLISDDTRDAILNEIHGIMADDSNEVTWSVAMGNSAEEAVDNAVAGTFVASGAWSALRNNVSRPRVRGAWAVISVSSAAQWSYEAVAIKSRQLGRIR